MIISWDATLKTTTATPVLPPGSLSHIMGENRGRFKLSRQSRDNPKFRFSNPEIFVPKISGIPKHPGGYPRVSPPLYKQPEDLGKSPKRGGDCSRLGYFVGTVIGYADCGILGNLGTPFSKSSGFPRSSRDSGGFIYG